MFFFQNGRQFVNPTPNLNYGTQEIWLSGPHSKQSIETVYNAID